MNAGEILKILIIREGCGQCILHLRLLDESFAQLLCLERSIICKYLDFITVGKAMQSLGQGKRFEDSADLAHFKAKFLPSKLRYYALFIVCTCALLHSCNNDFGYCCSVRLYYNCHCISQCLQMIVSFL